MEALVERDPDVEVKLDIGDVVSAEVAGDAASVLLHHVRVGAPPPRVGPHLSPPPAPSITQSHVTRSAEGYTYGVWWSV